MMSSVVMTKATQSGGLGKLHINKSVFIDMIVLARVYPFMDKAIAWVLSRISGS
jgi:hypothetical protein